MISSGRLAVLSLIVFSAAFGCLAWLQPLDDSEQITILFTSDLHGTVLPYDYRSGETASGGLAQIATLVQRIRGANRNTILLDSGDAIQGNPLMYYAANQELHLPNPIISAMNLIGYDALAVGNHEFNFGMETLRSAQEQATYPFLSANTLDRDTGTPAFPPYVVLEKSGIRIGILGLVTPTIPSWELPDHIKGLEFIDPVEAAEVWVPKLREDERCDLVILLAHSGLEVDPDSGETVGVEGENHGIALATEVEGVDVVLTGHTHRLVEPTMIGNTMVTTCPPYGRSLIRIDVKMSPSAKNGWKVVSLEGTHVPVGDDIPVDEKIVASVKDAHMATERYLNTVIGTNHIDLRAEGARVKDTALVDFLQAAQLDATGADISLASLLVSESLVLPAGPIRVRDMFRFYPYENRLLKILVSGATLKAALEWSARFYDGGHVDESGKFILELDDSIRGYNVDFAEGVSYQIDPMQPEGDRIIALSFRGLPVTPEQEFTLAINNYRYSGGGGYGMFTESKVLEILDMGVREILIDYTTRLKELEPACSRNWSIAPALEPSNRK